MSARSARRARRFGAGAVLAAGAAAGWIAIGPAAAGSPQAHDHGDHPHHGDIAPEDLARVRQATLQFHDVQAALDSGRIDLNLCFDQMGQHYADPATFGDGVLDPDAPEALVYADDGDSLQLVAVEWVSTTPGEVLGVPLHLNQALGVWVLHAWVWHGNPDGTLADFNPTIGDC